MDNYRFNQLPIIVQVTYIRDNGNHLAVRIEDDCSISLYKVDNFFVEIWWKPDLFGPYKVRSFKSKKCLDPYLERININL